ncbi:isocitrate lyase/PEP mutase family protein [Caenimonas aquaedulcis]|uniref:Oxaloacetate decarboxylase n=1 Tax=Caenimonas aquaedulcis TaxID=2793270 RepID=A0A931H3Z1_9BURK|nr:oxaloacetate decarboxylase [Caenimonas aquaedulcis]MBG9388077.1 oxaloacetate decarboxylase [Caenimonas aquaedulcis]
MTHAERRAAFRRTVETRRGTLLAGAFNAMSARVIEDIGFEAVYLTGAGVTNMALGLPDFSYAGLNEIADHTARIRDVVALPLVVDADTGFGNAMNVRHTVKVLERSGADAIQMEDQAFPKKCGHFDGKAVISAAEMASKIKAAVDAREDPDFLVIGRTDARGVEGFEAAIERAHRYAEAGADILFVEAMTTMDEITAVAKAFTKPLLINIVVGGKTPAMPVRAFGEMGYSLVLYANTALQGAVLGMQRALGALKKDGLIEEKGGLVVGFAERQRLVGKPGLDELAKGYAT